jgi:hypothetical protein
MVTSAVNSAAPAQAAAPNLLDVIKQIDAGTYRPSNVSGIVDPALRAGLLKLAEAQLPAGGFGAKLVEAATKPTSPLDAFFASLMPDLDALIGTVKSVGDNVASSTIHAEIEKQKGGVKANAEFLTSNGIVAKVVDSLIKLLNLVKANSTLVTEYLAQGMQAVKTVLSNPQFALPMQLASIFNPSEVLSVLNSADQASIAKAPNAANN